MLPRPPDQLLRVVLVKADAHLPAPVEVGLVGAWQLRDNRLRLEYVVEDSVTHREQAALLHAIAISSGPTPDEGGSDITGFF
jgi:hypothetical protein